MNTVQRSIVDYLKTRPQGAAIGRVAQRCFLSYTAAYVNLEALAALGVLGKTFVKSRAWYRFVREL